MLRIIDSHMVALALETGESEGHELALLLYIKRAPPFGQSGRNSENCVSAAGDFALYGEVAEYREIRRRQ